MLFYDELVFLNPKNGTREDRASRQEDTIQFNNEALQLALLNRIENPGIFCITSDLLVPIISVCHDRVYVARSMCNKHRRHTNQSKSTVLKTIKTTTEQSTQWYYYGSGFFQNQLPPSFRINKSSHSTKKRYLSHQRLMGIWGNNSIYFALVLHLHPMSLLHR